MSTLRAVSIDGAELTLENAYAGRYPGTRRLYLCIRRGTVGTVAGLDRLATEFLSGAALGPRGHLLELGLVPLRMDDMIRSIALAKALKPVLREVLPE
jgi:phosphate transport system substrate-binding protein